MAPGDQGWGLCLTRPHSPGQGHHGEGARAATHHVARTYSSCDCAQALARRQWPLAGLRPQGLRWGCPSLSLYWITKESNWPSGTVTREATGWGSHLSLSAPRGAVSLGGSVAEESLLLVELRQK